MKQAAKHNAPQSDDLSWDVVSASHLSAEAKPRNTAGPAPAPRCTEVDENGETYVLLTSDDEGVGKGQTKGPAKTAKKVKKPVLAAFTLTAASVAPTPGKSYASIVRE